MQIHSDIRYKYWLAIAAMLITVIIYAVNLAFSRFSVQHGLSPYDLTALRFLVAGTLLTPYFFKLGWIDLGGLGWSKGTILALLAGSPYMFVLFCGLQFAPTSHAAVLNPGITPAVVFFGLICLGLQVFSLKRLVCLALIFIGIILVTSSSFRLKGDLLFGDFLLFLSGVSWGIFTLLCKLWQLKPLQATTIVSVISMVYLPVYFIFFYQGFAAVTWTHLISQAIYQGVLNAVIALYLLTYAIESLGAQRASLFSPLIPVLATLMAIPMLNEIPSFEQWTGIVVVIVGMLTASLLASQS